MHGGVLVPILRYREFNLGFLGSGSTTEIALEKAIPISPFTVIGLSLRVHAADIGASPGQFEIILRAVNPSPADGQDFEGSDLGSSDAVTANTTPPALLDLQTIITNPQAPFLRPVLKATGPNSGNLYAVLSADLVMKTG